jgi:NADPH2:quinone reductase
MKAIRVHGFGGPENLRLEEIDTPVPAAGQVVVEIRAAGVNPVDTYVRAGAHAVRPSLPYTPGDDGAGIVASAGPNVAWSPGDRVYVSGSITGTYAERVLCDATSVHALPAHLTFAQGAAVGIPYSTAVRALDFAHAAAGETLLVHGASGGVGVATVQLARAAGLIVIGTAGTAKGRDLVLRAGAHHVVDHHAPDADRQVADLTGGRGVDVVVEMLANRNLVRDLSMVAMRGRIVIVGSRGRIEIDPRMVMLREATITGVFHYSMSPEGHARAQDAVGAALASGAAIPVVGLELPLACAQTAHERIVDSPAHGKIVLIPGAGS